METLLNHELALEGTRKFTNRELLMMRKIIDDAIFRRMVRRQYDMNESLSRVMTNILSKAIADAGYSEILGKNLWVYCCPSFRDTNYKNKNGPSMIYCTRIGIYFNYGESITAKKYMDDEEPRVIDDEYKIEIRLKKSLEIKIEPPAHHVKTPPYENRTGAGNIRDSAKIKWILEQPVSRRQNCDIPKCIIKSPLPNSHMRKSIYGQELLKSLVDFYITKGNAKLLLDHCTRIISKYDQHFITSAHSTTMYFLTVGKFCPKALTGLSVEDQSNWNHIIPYDVIKLIAKHVWESRYENEIWGTDTREVLSIPQFHNVEPGAPSPPTYNEDRYSEYDIRGPHGWVPWFRP